MDEVINWQLVQEALATLRERWTAWNNEDAEAIDVIEAVGRYLEALDRIKDQSHGEPR